jgi:hypothetical protein
VRKEIVFIAAIGDQVLARRQRMEQTACPLVIAHLPFGERRDEPPAMLVADRVQLRV